MRWTDVRRSRRRSAAGGGALMDVGCYCVSFIRSVAGEEPPQAHAVAQIGKKSRVDEVTTGLLKFRNGVVANFSCAIQCGARVHATVYGTKGSMMLANPWLPRDDASIHVTVGGKTRVHVVRPAGDLYAIEARTVAKYLGAREAPAMTWADSLGQMRTLDALRQSMGLKFRGEKRAP